MPTAPTMQELGTLVRRDHDELHYALRVMAEPLSDESDVVAMLERVRAIFPAHVEAETLVLEAVLQEGQNPPLLYLLVSQVIAAHLAQETAFNELLAQRPGTPAFRERARYLRHMMVHHADHEAACLHPALPDHLPRALYRSLGGRYVDERHRRLEAHAATQAERMREVG